MYNSSINNEGKLDLEFPLIKFHPTNKTDWWKIRDAFEGVQIFGGIGSGKSSGSGKAIAKSFLKNGFGGLVLCAKSDEKDSWIEYARETNRLDDLIIFSEDSDYEFNPLQYEMTRTGRGAGEVFNLTNLFMEIYKMGNRFTSGGSSGESERYWDNALRRCINRMIELLKLADETLSIENMRRLISYAPTQDETSQLSEKTENELAEWAEANFCIHCIIQAGENLDDEDEEADANYTLVTDYFLREFANLAEKTRSTIVESFLGLAEPFISGILKKHFSGNTNIVPEITFEGKIIILDFAVKEYLASGIYAQGIFKLLWQQAIERRNIKTHPMPVFLWVDESQYFVNEYDTIFQTTARSSRACTVFLTQNISNYYSQMGGSASKSKVDSLLGNLSTKIFHSNNDAVTNEWASKVIGKKFLPVEGGSVQSSGTNIWGSNSIGESFTMQLQPQVLPYHFTVLSSGGKSFDYKVQAIIQIKGKKWSDGKNYKRISFHQKK